MSITRRVAHNTAILFIGRLLGLLISLGAFALVTRSLGVAGYGEFTTIFAYITFFGTISDFGFSWIFTRELSLAQSSAEEERVAGTILGFRILFSLFWALVAALGLLITPYSPVVRLGIMYALINMTISGFNGTLVSIFQSKLRMDLPTLSDIISRVVGLGLFYLVSRGGSGVVGFVVATVFAVLVGFITNAWLVRSFIRLRLSFDLSAFRSLLIEIAPMGLIVVLGLIYFKIDTLILSLLRSPAEVGLYGAAYRIFEILLVFPALFLGVVTPELARSLRDDQERASRILQRAFTFLAFLSGGLLIFLPFASQIIELAAGREFVETSYLSLLGQPIHAGIILAFLIPVAMISYLGHLFGTTIISLRAQRRLILPHLLAVIINVILNLIFIPRYSYLAAAVITLVTELLAFTLQYTIVSRSTGFRPQLAPLGLSFGSGLVVAAVLFAALRLTNSLPVVILLGLIGVLAYLGLVTWLRVVPWEDWQSVLSRERTS